MSMRKAPTMIVKRPAQAQANARDMSEAQRRAKAALTAQKGFDFVTSPIASRVRIAIGDAATGVGASSGIMNGESPSPDGVLTGGGGGGGGG